MHRRDFLKASSVSAAAAMAARTSLGSVFASPQAANSPSPVKIESFGFQNVRLRESRWRSQSLAARDFYYGIPDDNILFGFRAAANQGTAGNPLSGWCARDSSTVFGQWLSGMARLSRATGDAALRGKAVRLMTEWNKTIGADGNCRMGHYPYDKIVGGLVDMQLYAGRPDAVSILEKITDWAGRTFDRENAPGNPKESYFGRPGEWYTLSENLYRAYELTGNPKFKRFAEVWLYPAYWNKFADTAAPEDAQGVHAYSHVNTFSGAAMAYAVTGESVYLRILKNFYEYMQNAQCFATGGYGPVEHFMKTDGSLGRSLETRYDTFETSCGSWAGFKLSQYLMRFTGEARYGDWIEKLLYNGIGAALPIAEGGKNFYYSDYRVGGGMKVYNWETYTCCAGTYIQNMAAYHDLIYFKDGSGLYVNLYLPSEVVVRRPEGDIKVVQETKYPEAETIILTVDAPRPAAFALRLRVPGWASGMTVAVNGLPAGVPCVPGTWAVLSRTWNKGDKVEVRIPLRFRYQAVDAHHPDRVAVVRGPVVMVEDNSHHNPLFRLPEGEDDLNAWLVPAAAPGVFAMERLGGRKENLVFRPFYALGEGYPYRMYLDKKDLPIELW